MKNTFRPVPFIRLLIPLIMGILLGEFMPINGIAYGLFVAVPALLYFAFKKDRNLKLPFGILAFLCLFLIGHLLVEWQDISKNEDHFHQQLDEEEITWTGIVTSMPLLKKNVETEIRLESIQKDGKWIKVSGNLKAYFKKDAENIHFEYGDRIVAESRIRKMKSTTNPKSFDYANYLKHLQIYHTSYVNEDHSILLDKGHGMAIFNWSYSLRNHALKVLKKHLKSENSRAVGFALILGYKEEMTEEVQAAYSNTGATHVLAVSGLHVGILFLIVKFFFGFIRRKNKYIPWIKLAISLFIIWGFTLITGASPSVLRAATMFTFVAIGDVMDRNKNIYNTLAASAFLLLCFNPYFLFSPGFQLSYLAVIGIVFFQPLIYKSWYVKNKLGNYIWTLMSVSLAAQIATIPISLYYFHQFPTYFLLSGLVVIPAASIIMAVGLGTLLLSAVPYTSYITSFLGDILYWVIWFVNSIIFFLGKMPFNTIGNISISFFEMILGYIIVGLLMLWLSKDHKRYLFYALWALVLMGLVHSARQINNKNKEEIVFYDTNGTIIDYINKGKRITYKSDKITEKNEFYATEGYRVDAGFYEESKNDFFEKSNFIQIGDKRFFILSEDYWDLQSKRSIAVDGIIIQNNPYVNFDKLVEEFDFQFIIADGSNYENNVEKWRGYAADTNKDFEFYYTKEKAVIIE